MKTKNKKVANFGDSSVSFCKAYYFLVAAGPRAVKLQLNAVGVQDECFIPAGNS